MTSTLYTKFKNARLYRENLQPAPITHKKRHEITHICVSKAGVLKNGGLDGSFEHNSSKLQLEIPSISPSVGEEKPRDDVAGWLVKYTISRTSDDRIPC